MNKNTVSTKQAAEMLEVSYQTIVNWWNDGVVEGYKLNPSKSNSPLRILKNSVEEILRAREVKPFKLNQPVNKKGVR